MDEPKQTASAEPTPPNEVKTAAPSSPDTHAMARGSGNITKVPDVPVVSRARTEDSVMEGLPTAKMERIAAMRRDLAELQRQLTDAQQRIATELQGRADDAERFETLEEELRLELAAREAQLETKSTALNEARNLLETRVVELGTRDSEIALLKSERDALKRENDEIRAKARDIGNRIVQFGQGLLDGNPAEAIAPIATIAPVAPIDADAGNAATAEPKPVVARTTTSRQQPPPLPPRKAEAPSEPQAVEAIFEVIEEPKPRAGRSWLMLLGGVILGCAATFAYAKVTDADAPSASQAAAAPANTQTQAESHADQAQPPAPIATVDTATPAANPAMPVEALAPATASAIAAPAAPAATAPAITAPAVTPPEATAPAVSASSTDGTLVLPVSAAGHRIYVDDKVVEVKDSRVAVHCGSHQVRIGSHGTPRTLDVTCGGETQIPADE